MSLPELCIRRPVMTTLLMISFVVVGIFGYRLLPVAALPRVDFPTINVSASLPGASPETMASAVATPLEKQFSTIAGITSMTSTNGLGTTQITLQFDLGRNIDGAALDVQSAITSAARLLPAELTTPPSFRKVNPADQPVMFLGLSSDTLPLSSVDEYAETMIAQRLSTLPGVAQVAVYGAQKYAVRVQVDPKTLSAAGINFDDIASALAAANSNRPVGQLDGAQKAVTLQASGQLAKAASYQPLIVAYRNGNPVRLGDVAQILDGVENNKVASWYNGKRAITLAIQRQPDANTIEVVDAVKATLPQFRAVLPASVKLDTILDRSVSIRESVADVQFTLALTIALVVMVIFLFLRSLTATLIPMLALPVSIIGTFAGMYLLGYSVDNLSLLALTLSVGFVVDDAIVMLENIVRHVEEGMTPMQAAMKGSREIAFTILSITLSLVAVFIPVFFMGGIVGRLFNEFAVTISMAILISGIVSLTLTPMLCSRFLRPHKEEAAHKKSWLFFLDWFEAGFEASRRGYGHGLKFALRHRLIILAVTFGTIALTGYLYVVIPKGFFPLEDTGQLLAVTEAPQDVSFEAMSTLTQQAANIIAQDPAVDAVNPAIGSGGLSPTLNQGRMFIGLKPLHDRAKGDSAGVVIQRLRQKLASLQDMRVYLQAIQNINVGGRLTKSQFQYTVQGDDFHQLQELVPKLEERLRQLPQMQDVSSDLQIRNPQAMVDIDRDRAATLGITADAIRQTLYSAFGSRQVATIYTPTNEYEVILEVGPKYQQDTAALKDIYVRAGDGHLVPLESVATIRRNVGPSSVNHQGQLPSVTLSFNLTPGNSLGQAVDAIHSAERDLNLPANIITGFQGTAQVFQDSLRGQGLLLAAAVFVIYVMLGILYESFIHPITILSGLPAASIGALLTLLLFKTDLSVIAVIGVVMLIGIVKKNAIMMIDVALEKRRIEKLPPEQAIFEACLLRYRPIMMTTMAAIMGALPIALGSGAGAELRQPLGLAVVGGLIVSQLLTLFITPVIYIYMDKLQTRLGGEKKASPEPAAASPPELARPIV